MNARRRSPARRTGVRHRTSSRRRPLVGPLLVLLVLAAIPAIALFATFRWADERADAADEAPPPASELAPLATPTPSPPLETELLTVRRMPTIVSRDVSLGAFVDELGPFLGTLNDRSCVAVSVDGVPVGATNADVPVIPASAQKIIVAGVALDALGADFRYVTTADAVAAPADGAIAGDLYLVGGGDPLLTTDWYPTSNLERYPVTTPTRLEELADDLVAQGVTSIGGNVVGDGSRYDDEWYAPGWGDGVAGLDAGPYDALLVNDARVLGDPERSGDPVLAAAREFTRLLQDRGISIGGEPATGTAPAESVELAAVESAPLSDVVAEMLANSDNNTAELMLKEIGLDASGAGTREAGAAAALAALSGWEIATDQLVISDGSGLSPSNRLTCAALQTVLASDETADIIAAGLPIAAESGTLSDAFVDHSLAGNLLGKTGTLNNPPFNVDPPAVKALAGYVPVDGGSMVEYALVLNGPTISDQSEYRPVWYSLGDAMATYPAGPTPAELGP